MPETPNVHRPNVHRPNVHQPNVHQPNVHRPNVHRPNVHRPNVHQPNVHRPNVHRDTNQEARRDTVQLNIVEDDENVMSEPCSCSCSFNCDQSVIFGLIGLMFGVTMCFLIGYLCYLGTVASGYYLTVGLVLAVMFVSFCTGVCKELCCPS